MFDRFSSYFKGSQQQRKISRDKWAQGFVWMSKIFTLTENGNISERLGTGKEALKTRFKPNQVGNVGHVAAKLSGAAEIYASHWPDENGASKKGVIKKGVPTEQRTFEKDRSDEGCDPKISPRFYSLDHEKMQQKYEELKKRNWALKGKKSLYSVDNCSSFVYKILSAGGIDKLSSKCSKLYWKTTLLEPKDLLECMLDAKKREQQLYPQTKQYDKYHDDL